MFETIELDETDKLLTNPSYDNSRPTMMYAFGYTANYTTNDTQTILDAFIVRGGYNLLVFEWSNYNSGNYLFNAVRNTRPVASIYATTLLRMKSEGFDLENFYLVGHSLGAQMVGFIGRDVQGFSNNETTITRITALDPAGPAFYGFTAIFNGNGHVNRDDGETLKFLKFGGILT